MIRLLLLLLISSMTMSCAQVGAKKTNDVLMQCLSVGVRLAEVDRCVNSKGINVLTTRDIEPNFLSSVKDVCGSFPNLCSRSDLPLLLSTAEDRRGAKRVKNPGLMIQSKESGGSHLPLIVLLVYSEMDSEEVLGWYNMATYPKILDFREK